MRRERRAETPRAPRRRRPIAEGVCGAWARRADHISGLRGRSTSCRMPRGRRPRIPASTGGGSAHDAADVWNGGCARGGRAAARRRLGFGGGEDTVALQAGVEGQSVRAEPRHDDLLLRRREATGRADQAAAVADGRLLLHLPNGERRAVLQAPLRTDPEQRSIALYQAARYSRYCRVYAPI